MNEQAVIDATRRWIRSIVIGLNLCPFARRVFAAEKIRYVVSDAADEAGLLNDLANETLILVVSPNSAIETTLLIHPYVLNEFLDYNDFLGVGEYLIEKLGQRGIVQIASFHPGYQFADAEPEAVENYTNRSPYPMLHLLREESISAVAGDPNQLLEIPRRNTETLRKMGLDRILQKLKAISRGGFEFQASRIVVNATAQIASADVGEIPAPKLKPSKPANAKSKPLERKRARPRVMRSRNAGR